MSRVEEMMRAARMDSRANNGMQQEQGREQVKQNR